MDEALEWQIDVHWDSDEPASLLREVRVSATDTKIAAETIRTYFGKLDGRSFSGLTLTRSEAVLMIGGGLEQGLVVCYQSRDEEIWQLVRATTRTNESIELIVGGQPGATSMWTRQ